MTLMEFMQIECPGSQTRHAGGTTGWKSYTLAPIRPAAGALALGGRHKGDIMTVSPPSSLLPHNAGRDSHLWTVCF